MKKDVDAFKKELENYSYYKINLEGTNRMIEYNEYLLSNVRGIDPSKEPVGSSSIWVESEAFERIAAELDKLYNRRKLRMMQIDYIESVLDKLSEETRQACIDIYVKGQTYVQISDNIHLSKTGLFRRIQSELNKAIL